MFKVINKFGHIYEAYGTFIDDDGDVQFILSDPSSGIFFSTNKPHGYYRLYREGGEK